MTTVCAYLSVPTCLCLPLCLPVCAYVCAYRLCLPSVPTCLCLPVCNLGEGRPDQSSADSIDRLIDMDSNRSLRAVRWLYIQRGSCALGGLDLIWRRANIKALVQFDRSID